MMFQSKNNASSLGSIMSKDIEINDLYDLREFRPKLIPLKDLIHIESQPQQWLTYAKNMIKNSYLYEGVTKENFYDFMSVTDQNHWYHSVKLMWLMNEIKTHGLYSYPQAYVKDNGRWVVHPGQFRVHALICLEITAGISNTPGTE